MLGPPAVPAFSVNSWGVAVELVRTGPPKAWTLHLSTEVPPAKSCAFSFCMVCSPSAQCTSLGFALATPNSSQEPIPNVEMWKRLDHFMRSADRKVTLRYVELRERKEAIEELTQRAVELGLMEPEATVAAEGSGDVAAAAAAGPSTETPGQDASRTMVVYTGIVWPQGWGSLPVYGVWFGEEDSRNVVAVAGDGGDQSQNRVELQA